MTTIAIVDYGMGNLRSVAQALRAAAPEADVQVVDQPEAIRAADRVVLPGQGAMPDCMGALGASGLQQAVIEAAASKPMLGVCVGEQMLFDFSKESRAQDGSTPCLGLLPGEVIRFELEGMTQPDGSRYKVPQMGWNRVRQARSIRCGLAFLMKAGSISCIVTTCMRRIRRISPAKPTTVSYLRARWRAIIFLPRSSTRKRAPPWACSCTGTLCTGIPEPR